MICPHARRQAAAAFGNLPDTISFTGLPESSLPQPNSDEALVLDAEIKPVYYGILGHAVSYVVAAAIASDLPVYNKIRDFDDLRDSTDAQLKDALDSFYNDDSQAAIRSQGGQLQGIRSYLRPVTYPSLKQSLRGGVGTAAASSTRLLQDYARSLPGLDMSGDRVGVLRKSYGSLIEIASCNSAQLFMIDEMQQTKSMPPIVYNPSSRTMRYEYSPLDVPINDAMRARFERMIGGRTAARTTREITTTTPVIGCPILLKPGQLQKFWNWTVDQAVQRGLVG